MLQDLTIMIVDDDDDYCFIAEIIFKKAGIGNQCIKASNGSEALEKLLEISAKGEKIPEVILLDLKMPVMDGFQFLEEVRNKPDLDLSQAKVYVSTSSILPKDKEKAFTYSITGFIPKPITKEILKNLLA